MDSENTPERLLVAKSDPQELIRTTAAGLAGSGLQGQKLGLGSHTGFLRVKILNNALWRLTCQDKVTVPQAAPSHLFAGWLED